MQQILRAIPLLAIMALAACGTTSTANLGPTLAQPNPNFQTAPLQPLTPAPAQQIATAQAMTNISSFVDAQAVALLSPREQTEASAAQFNALQFGRPGAPRAWQGDKGASGNVLVGPYVRVNSIDCRDFTHTVTIAGKPYVKKGTACRELDGSWAVANAS